jgi:hypothetical protein
MGITASLASMFLRNIAHLHVWDMVVHHDPPVFTFGEFTYILHGGRFPRNIFRPSLIPSHDV